MLSVLQPIRVVRVVFVMRHEIEEDDEIDEHEHAARAEREPLDGECLVLCGFAPSLLMLRGGQPLDIERLRRPVDAARMALRAHIERANYCTRRAHSRDFSGAELGDSCIRPRLAPHPA